MNEPAAQKYGAKSYRMVITSLLMGGCFVNAVDRGSLSVAAPFILKEFNLDPAMMGLVLSAFFWPYFLLQIPSGILADKFGSKIVLGWAAAFWSLASAATGMVTNFTTLLFARASVGVGEAAAMPINAKVVADNFPPSERATTIGLYGVGVRLGMAATPILIAYLISLWNWRAAFVITGLGSLVWVVLWYFLFKDSGKPRANEQRKSIPWKEVLTNRATLGLVLTKFFQDYVLYLLMTWVPTYLVMERGFSIMKMGIFASLPWICGMLTTVLFGYVSDSLIRRGVEHTKARKYLSVGLNLSAALLMAVGFVDDPIMAVYLISFCVACESGATGLTWTMMTEVSPTKLVGSVGGVMNTAGAMAGIIAPTLTGVIVKYTGSFQVALMVGGFSMLMAAFAVWFILPDIRPMQVEEN